MAARFKIIILDRDDRKINCAMWADVPAARQTFYANVNVVSAWKDALATDNTALQTGAVAEQLISVVMESGDTNAQSRAKLVQSWQSFQDQITALNKWDRYGSTYDGTTWIAAGAA